MDTEHIKDFSFFFLSQQNDEQGTPKMLWYTLTLGH